MKHIFAIAVTLSFAIGALAQRKTRTSNTQTLSNYSFASNTEHEVVLSASSASVQSYNYGKSRTDIAIYAAYNQHIQGNIQVGGEGGVLAYNDSNGDSKALFAAMGVFTWNFDTNLRDAFFVQGGAGLYPSYDKDDGDFNSSLSFFAGGGKRFEMWGKVNYMPYARIWKRGDEKTRFEIQAFNFSIFY